MKIIRGFFVISLKFFEQCTFYHSINLKLNQYIFNTSTEITLNPFYQDELVLLLRSAKRIEIEIHELQKSTHSLKKASPFLLIVIRRDEGPQLNQYGNKCDNTKSSLRRYVKLCFRMNINRGQMLIMPDIEKVESFLMSGMRPIIIIFVDFLGIYLSFLIYKRKTTEF